MKKTILFIIAIFLAGITGKVSGQTFEQGNVVIAAGYGWPNLIGTVFKIYETEAGFKASSAGPVYIKGEYCIADHLGLGINFAWSSSKATYISEGLDSNFNSVDYDYEIKRSTYSILARINYHFGDFEKFDPYVGGGLGYRNANWTFSDNDPSSSGTSDIIPNLFPFGFELTIGGRYYFSDNFGVYAELGFAKSPIQGGLVLKI
ncbi:MAG TPA: outer membrane beta-barrel protein [Chitinophagales bacterium]|nr:outer membrane beta-barrel protein [Chitinophagales bacterium]